MPDSVCTLRFIPSKPSMLSEVCWDGKQVKDKKMFNS